MKISVASDPKDARKQALIDRLVEQNLPSTGPGREWVCLFPRPCRPEPGAHDSPAD
jgi:hypothetical protein